MPPALSQPAINQTARAKHATPSTKQLFTYSALAFPLAFAGLPLYIHVPDYYTRHLGLNIGLIGIILLAVRLIDAFQDPLIGYVSDRFAAGRKAIITTGVSLLAIGMGGLFYGPQMGVNISLWFTLAMIIAMTGFSIVSINITTIGGLWHPDSAQRTRISAWREAMALLGLLFAASTPALLQQSLPIDQSFHLFFWLFAGLVLICFLVFMRFLRGIAVDSSQNQQAPPARPRFIYLFQNGNIHFFALCFLSHLAAAIPAVMVLIFIRDYLKADGLSGLFLLIYFISGASLMWLWVKLARRFGKGGAWALSMGLSVITFIGAFFLQEGDVIGYGVVCLLSGLALGADLALPPSLLADRISQQKSQPIATQYYALLAFIPKFALALASGTTFILLDSFGFVAGGDNSPHSLKAVVIIYALVPCLIKLGAALYLTYLLKTKRV